MNREISLYQATKGLRIEIRQLNHELEWALKSGRRGEVKRIRRELQIRRDSMRNWIQLEKLMKEKEQE